uniref:Cap-specific mRNA (nucleoside-2'-O-)-methyltransferase n=1 Tax=viral metagenome TaxID=1070528 RepID=A0A6C0BFA1_9ZZZZ
MALLYKEAKVQNLVYSGKLEELYKIKVNLKKNQRKYNEDLRLFIAELFFLLHYIKPEEKKVNRIVYIGASPGFHLCKLIKMFPDLKFDLYDDQDIHPDLYQISLDNSEQVIFYKERFTIETCERYNTTVENIYLLTDHREPRYMKDPIFKKDEDGNLLREAFQNEKENSYTDDMNLQREICKKLKPLIAYLRFRPPHYYEENSSQNASLEYFKGDVILMIYNDYKSTESRLIVTNFDDDKFLWNYKSYQYRLNYFNDVVRESLLANPFTNDQTPLKNQLGNKFETVMLIYLLKCYFELQGITNIKSDSVISFYTGFVIVETCSSIPGMIQNCDINENAYSSTEDDVFQDEIYVIDELY